LFLLYYGALTIASFSCLYTDWSKACFYRSVRAVRSFVCLLLNLWIRYFENKLTNFDVNWPKWSTGQEHETVNLRCQEIEGHGHTRPKYLRLSDEF